MLIWKAKDKIWETERHVHPILIMKMNSYSQEVGDSILNLKDQLNTKEKCSSFENVQQNRGSEVYIRDANLRIICI